MRSVPSRRRETWVFPAASEKQRILPATHRAIRSAWVVGTVLLVLLASVSLGLATHGRSTSLPVAVAARLDAAPSTAFASHPVTGPGPGIGAHRLISTPLRSANPHLNPLQGTPSWLAYDGADQSLYVAVPPSSVDIAPANTSGQYRPQINVSVPVGTNPFGVAYDRATGDVFVTNTRSDNVSVLFGNRSTPITSIAVGVRPMGVAYDPVNGEIYVADNGSANLTVINGTSLTVTTSIPVGDGPLGVAADPNTGAVFVADYGADEITKISGATNRVVATRPVGSGPYGVAVDPVTGAVYVTDSGSSNISVLSGSTASFLATISVWGDQALQGIAYDGGDGYMWVGAGLNLMVVVYPANESVYGYEQFDPAGVTDVPNTGDVCVTNTANTTLECLVFSSGAVLSPPTTFTESGLPPGTQWSVIVGSGVPTARSNSSQIVIYSPFPLPAWYFGVPSTGPYFAGPLTANGTNRFGVVFSLVPGVYPVTFAETGLPLPYPSYAGWSVDLGNSTRTSNSTTLSMPDPNGTYAFSVPIYDSNYSYAGSGPFIAYPEPCHGNVTVNGTGVEVMIAFSISGTICRTVQFDERGLPVGRAWNVTLDSVFETAVTPDSSLQFSETPGTYDFTVGAETGYVVSPASGTVSLNGSAVVLNLTFTSEYPTYLVTFAETGLASGASWSATLAGGTTVTTLTTIRYSEANGSYTYSILGPSGYFANPSSGRVNVTGAAVVVSVAFSTPVPIYAVTFSESGLPPGSPWTVDLAGVAENSTTIAITFEEPNGSYRFVVDAVAGFPPSPSAGWRNVSGAAVMVDIAYTSGSLFSVSLVESGLPNGTSWSAHLGGAMGSSPSDTIGFTEPNGTYVLNVTPVSGYPVNFSSLVVVRGGPLAVAITFSNATYPVVISESGLPTGSLWTTTARDEATDMLTTGQSTGTTLTLDLLDGTYSLSMDGPAGYRVALPVSTVSVQGASPAPLAVSFTTTSPGGSTTGPGAFGLLTAVYLLTAVLVGVGAVWGYARYRSERWKAEGERWVRKLREEGREPDDERPQ